MKKISSGASSFNLQISLSLLTKNSIRIKLTNKELNLSYIKLICKITNGSKYTIKSDDIFFTPGRLVGGIYEHICQDEIFNYIIYLLIILPFSDKKTIFYFKGITDKDNCIDIIRIAYFKMLKIFNIPDLELTVKKRGFYGENNAEGEVIFTCCVLKELKNIDSINTEYLEKTRALLISARLNSTYVHDMSEKLKKLLSDFNLKVFMNIYNRNDSGPCPGFQCTLFSESKQGIFFYTEDGGNKKPVEVVENAANNLMRSIYRGGIFDNKLNDILFVYLALSSTDVSRIKISKLSDANRETLDILKKVLNFKYQIKKEQDEYIFISSGIGFSNYNLKLK